MRIPLCTSGIAPTKGARNERYAYAAYPCNTALAHERAAAREPAAEAGRGRTHARQADPDSCDALRRRRPQGQAGQSGVASLVSTASAWVSTLTRKASVGGLNRS